MPAWTSPRTPVPPPGAVEPLPDITTPGWAAWAERAANATADRDLPAGAPRRFQVTLEVTLGAREIWPISGDAPGPWEKTQTAQTPPGERHRDWTRFSRRYPRLIWQEVQAVNAVVVIDFLGVLPPRRYFSTFHVVLRGPVVEVGRVVHRWLRTSGERVKDDGTRLLVEDLSVRPDDRPVPTPEDLGVGDDDLPNTDDYYFDLSWPGKKMKPGREWTLEAGIDFGYPYNGRWILDRVLRETVERHARENAVTDRETDAEGDAAEAERARRRRRQRR